MTKPKSGKTLPAKKTALKTPQLSKAPIMATSPELDALTASVTRTTDVEASAVQLLQGLKTALDAAIAANTAGDPTKLAALSASLGTGADSLAAAIIANTPAA